MRIASSLARATALLALAVPALAQTVQRSIELIAPTLPPRWDEPYQYHSFFGEALAVDGDTLAVTSLPSDGTAAVQFYASGPRGWAFAQALELGGSPSRLQSVAIDGDRAVCGDIHSPINVGRAFVLRRVAGRWEVEQELPYPGDQPVARFGWSVALFGDQVVVGATITAERALASGSAFVYSRHAAGDWRPTQHLLPPANVEFVTERSGWMGVALSISAGDLLIGAPRHHGAVLAYRREHPQAPWRRRQILHSASSFSSESFGRSLDHEGNTLVVGAPTLFTSFPVRPGRAVIFERPSVDADWVQVRTLFAPAPFDGDEYAAAVDLAGDRLVIGNRGRVNNTGGATVHQRDAETAEWNPTETRRLIPTHPNEGDDAGWSVAMAGDVVFAGAPGKFHPIEGTRTGGVEVFELGLGQVFCRRGDPTQAKLRVMGSGEAQDPGVLLSLHGLEPRSVVVLLASARRAGSPFTGNGLCLGGTPARMAALQAGASGWVQHPVAPSSPLLAGLTSGATLYFQGLGRPGRGGATGAVAVPFR